MNNVPIWNFMRAIHENYGATARYLHPVTVNETFEGKPVWTGEVLVFQLLDHPTAIQCYAWEVDGEVTAILHEGPVRSARDAVRTSIMAG